MSCGDNNDPPKPKCPDYKQPSGDTKDPPKCPENKSPCDDNKDPPKPKCPEYKSSSGDSKDPPKPICPESKPPCGETKDPPKPTCPEKDIKDPPKPKLTCPESKPPCGDTKVPPKPICPEKIAKPSCDIKSKKTETESDPKMKKTASESDPCSKHYPSKGFEEIFKKQQKKEVCEPMPPPVSLSRKKSIGSLKAKGLLNKLKDMLPGLNLGALKNLEYGKFLQYGMCKLNIMINEIRNPKMADKGAGAAGSGRAMKFPYTFSAKIAQFPMGHYVKNQWIWKYYVVAFAACIPIFYSINKLSNSPGNVAKWAEIRRKEAAEHHH